MTKLAMFLQSFKSIDNLLVKLRRGVDMPPLLRGKEHGLFSLMVNAFVLVFVQ